MSEISAKDNKKDLNKKAAVAGAFYVVAQLFVRGITFLVTPIYSRLLSTAQYGEIRVYESWLLIAVPVMSLCLYRSVERAKFDFPDKFNEYVSSVQTLSYLTILGCYLFISIFIRRAFMDFCSLDLLMYVFMIMYTFSYTAIQYFQRREKQLLRYKNSVLLTALTMAPGTIFSILALYWGNISGNEAVLVDIRVVAFYTPQIIGGLIVIFAMWKQGRFCVDRKYWGYALRYSVPLIPEMLSIQIMNQSDKIMVQKMTGSECAGIFAMAATISYIIWILEDSVWGGWLPWLYEKIARGEKDEVEKPWYFVARIFGYISWMLVVLAPEIIFILGGDKYASAVYLVAPMVTGTLFRFYSYSFSAVANYMKKTQYCAAGTVAAMVVNVILNYVCILNFGYQAAAYTTAFSYFLLMAVQGLMEKKICGMRIVSLGKMTGYSLLFLGINLATIILYGAAWYLRWGVALAVSASFLALNYRNIMPLYRQIRGK